MNRTRSRLLPLVTVAILALVLLPGLSNAAGDEDLTPTTRALKLNPSLEDQVMEMVNEERWNNGQLPPLKRNSLLDASSELHSFNMADRNFFAHCDLDTDTQPWDRMIDEGYIYAGAAENIAAGSSTAAGVMNQWMNSAGHRANILATHLTELGIGHYYQSGDQNNIRFDANSDCNSDQSGLGPYYHYWTQNFGTRAGNYPVVIEREAFETDSRVVDLYLYGGNWATEMRIRNENGSFTAWQPFSSDVSWSLSSGNGTKTVYVEIRNNNGTTRSASDSIELEIAANVIFTDGFESGNLSAWTVVGP